MNHDQDTQRRAYRASQSSYDAREPDPEPDYCEVCDDAEAVVLGRTIADNRAVMCLHCYDEINRERDALRRATSHG